MSHAVLSRSDLFSQTQAGAILGVDRRTVRDMARVMNLAYKHDPTRVGKMLDRDDLDRLAASLAKSIDWASIEAA